jgi:hypothetical protein
MRVAALVLVLFGGLVVGSWGFATLGGTPEAAGRTGFLSPVAGGIALVSGLLMLVGTGHRTDAETR